MQTVTLAHGRQAYWVLLALLLASVSGAQAGDRLLATGGVMEL